MGFVKVTRENLFTNDRNYFGMLGVGVDDEEFENFRESPSTRFNNNMKTIVKNKNLTLWTIL